MKSYKLAGFLPLIFLLTACSAKNVVANSIPEVSETSDATFVKDVLQSKKPVLVDFYATWCGPCRMMAPVVDQLSVQYHDKVKVVRLDIDKNPGIAQALGIQSIPTFAVFKAGKPVAGVVGAVPKQELAQEIDQSLR